MNNHKPEFIIGLIGAVGVDFSKVISMFKYYIHGNENLRYKIHVITLSPLAIKPQKKEYNTEVERINKAIDFCNKVVEKKIKYL